MLPECLFCVNCVVLSEFHLPACSLVTVVPEHKTFFNLGPWAIWNRPSKDSSTRWLCWLYWTTETSSRATTDAPRSHSWLPAIEKPFQTCQVRGLKCHAIFNYGCSTSRSKWGDIAGWKNCLSCLALPCYHAIVKFVKGWVVVTW